MEDLSLEDLESITAAIREHPPGGSPFDGVTFGQLLALALLAKETLDGNDTDAAIDMANNTLERQDD